MRSFLPFLLPLFLFFPFTSINAQRIDFGLGFHSNHGKLFLDNQISEVIDSFSLFSRISNKLGANVFLEITTKNSLTLRTSISQNQHQVKIAVLEDLDARRRNRELFEYNFSTTELELQASYLLAFPESGWSIYPSLGFSIGMSNLNTISYSQRGNYVPAEFRNLDHQSTINLDIGDQLTYATINGGLRIILHSLFLSVRSNSILAMIYRFFLI